MKIIYLFLAVILLITLVNCKKKNDTYSIKGRILKDCSGMPLSSYSLRLWYKAANSLSDSRDLGTAITDADGNFRIDSIPFGHRVSLYLFHDVNANKIISWYDDFNARIDNSGDTYDLGTFYETSEKNTIFRLNIDTTKFVSIDSLYVGPDRNNFKALFPIPTTVALAFSYTNPTGLAFAPDHYVIYWSTRKSHYDSLTSPQPPTDKNQHSFNSLVKLCAFPDTSFITIP